jgi:hypothetical protein
MWFSRRPRVVPLATIEAATGRRFVIIKVADGMWGVMHRGMRIAGANLHNDFSEAEIATFLRAVIFRDEHFSHLQLDRVLAAAMRECGVRERTYKGVLPQDYRFPSDELVADVRVPDYALL